MEQNHEKSRIKQTANIIGWLLEGVACVALLSVVVVHRSDLPPAEGIGQWLHFDHAAGIAAICLAVALCLGRDAAALPKWTGRTLALFATIEAVYGLCQLYGFEPSHHSRFALTGSFFNPGPYSGYIAMALPVCLHGWLTAKGVVRYLYALPLLLALCVLPAGMSRAAWVAATVSSAWVYGCHKHWGGRLRNYLRLHRRQAAGYAIGLTVVATGAGMALFALKPDSARGRLLMWKVSGKAIAEKPWSGHGWNSFAGTYGKAQEAYFAQGDFTQWEELVAGSPEYAFNEYLQTAVELGVPLTVGLVSLLIGGIVAGKRKGRVGLCGAMISLMTFAAFSYPMRLPVFIVTGAMLWTACVMGRSRWQYAAIALLLGVCYMVRTDRDKTTERACAAWANARVLYHAGGYHTAIDEYAALYPWLKDRAAFLFEYGHSLHKEGHYEESSRVLAEALRLSSDPMILNVMGKNSQELGRYAEAEAYLLRSTHRLPGRIYPYYLLAKLYALPDYRKPAQFEVMRQKVLTKQPKVMSTAIRQMREEIEEIAEGV